MLARVQPESADEDLRYLQSVEWEVAEWPWIYTTAIELSIRIRHHLLDTLYHATALRSESATLVTADEGYYRKAHVEGRIALLRDFDAAQSPQAP